MAQLHLAGGGFAEVDWEDLTELSKHEWKVNPYGYVFRYATKRERASGWPQAILLHRWLLKAPKLHIVDHRDTNKLNNRKSNLRLCNRSQNAANAYAHQDARSRFRGVCWSSSKRLWRASIQRGGRWMHIGYFDAEEDAARAYDAAAVKLFGEFARPNFKDIAPLVPAKRLLRRSNTSGYRGVSYYKPTNKWHASIEIKQGGKRKAIHLGYFDTPEAAALAYNEAAMRFQGERAVLNAVTEWITIVP